MSKLSSLSDALLATGLTPGFSLINTPTGVSITFAAGTSQSQKDAANTYIANYDMSDAAQSTRDINQAIVIAKSLANDSSPTCKLIRGVLLTIMDELNVLRKRDRDRAADVAAATNLANLQSRWAARSALTDRVATHIKPAVVARLGTPDTI